MNAAERDAWLERRTRANHLTLNDTELRIVEKTIREMVRERQRARVAKKLQNK